jgi:hypothetical protein
MDRLIPDIAIPCNAARITPALNRRIPALTLFAAGAFG